MPDEVRGAVTYGMVAGVLQLVAAGVLGPVLAREVDAALGIAVGVALVVVAAVTLTTSVLLSRGSERARRFVAWPADRDVALLDLGVAGWMRQRLRSRAAVRWFASRSEAHVSARTRRSGGPR